MRVTTFTLHHVDWCGYCQQVKPIWVKLKAEVETNAVRFVDIDEDKTRTPGIDEYPTITAVVGGLKFIYRGGANLGEMRRWVSLMTGI